MARRPQTSLAPAASAAPVGSAGAGPPCTYVSTKEAARIMRLSPRTLERLRTHGTGPRYLKPGRGIRSRVLYRLQDIEAWLETASFGSTSEYGRVDSGGGR